MLYTLYAVEKGESLKYYFTPCPEIDNYFWFSQGYNITWLSKPMIIGKIYPLYKRQLQNTLSESFLLKIKKWLGISNSPKAYDLQVAGNFPIPLEQDVDSLLSVIEGRILLMREIKLALKENSVGFESDLVHTLQLLYLRGMLEIYPAVALEKESYICHRCGENKDISEATCICKDNNCAYCNACVGMGQAKLCEALYAAAFTRDKALQEVIFQLDFSLTAPQQEAFEAVKAFIHNKTSSVGVVWAACGAGKTEVSFGAIKETLHRGGRVLYAIPRKDTVIEIAPRITKAFSQANIITLYGGSTQRYATADIVIATTHQCLRFYRNFSLVILDEADAFPYANSSMLYLAVERSREVSGKILYMSATPSDAMLKQVQDKKGLLVTVPARYHGFPLPVPSFLKDEKLYFLDGKEQTQISKEVIELMKISVFEEKTQVFLFVPLVSMTKAVANVIQEALPTVKVAYSHAKDKLREEKIQKFISGEIDIFVTTSIMERGITIPRASVFVLFADYSKIFSWRALLQMAGRAGRKKEHPMGKVWFIAKSNNYEITEAFKVIKKMNAEAKAKGFLTN